jgi:hypothetical protein
MIWCTLSRLIPRFRAMSLCLIQRFSWIMASTLHLFSSWVTEMGRPGLCSSKTLISPAQQLLERRTHLRTFFTSINCVHTPMISIGAQISSVKNSITDRCFIRKSAEALITKEHYCLRASNMELKLRTNLLHCIDYRTHAQTFLSSHY